MKSTKNTYHHGDLRAAILETAIELVAERGLDHLSLRECARRLGVSHAAPYRHFPTKDDLLSAIAGQGFHWLVEAALEAMASRRTPRTRLDAYGIAYVQFARAHPEHFRVMFGAKLEKVAPPDREASEAAFRLLRECAAALDTGADPELGAVAFWGLVHGLAMLMLDGRIPDSHVETEEAVESLTRACFRRWRS